jgi:hypothetical protein
MRNLLFARYSMFVVLALFSLVAMSSTAFAQYGYYGYNNGSIQVAINNGYQLGYGTGSNDRNFGHRYDINDSKAYRDGDSGYRSSGFGSKDEYRRLFRQGFEVGYRDGYNGFRRRGFYNPSNDGYYNPTYNNSRIRNRDNDYYYNRNSDSCSPRVSRRPRGNAYGHRIGRGNPHRY